MIHDAGALEADLRIRVPETAANGLPRVVATRDQDSEGGLGADRIREARDLMFPIDRVDVDVHADLPARVPARVSARRAPREPAPFASRPSRFGESGVTISR